MTEVQTVAVLALRLNRTVRPQLIDSYPVTSCMCSEKSQPGSCNNQSDSVKTHEIWMDVYVHINDRVNFAHFSLVIYIQACIY